MNLISLYSGIGGFELAGEWMGWDIVSSCEINPFCQMVLKHYWPNAYHHDNVNTINYEEVKKRINKNKSTIVVGGFPCQPFSTAGKRAGTEDERYGWPQCITAVRAVRPEWCLFENVRGLTNWNGGLVFDQVQADLEAEGYEVLPFLLPACGVNAPHRRDRIWFIAYAAGNRTNRTSHESSSAIEGQNRESIKQPFVGRQVQPVANTNRSGQQGQGRPVKSSNTTASGDWKKYRVVDDGRWPTQSPLCSRDDGISPELAGITFSKHRNESLKAYGNAIVTQVAYQIFKAIEEYLLTDETKKAATP